MACFICSKYGHWASKCPDANCKFCGERGHTTSSCQVRKSTQDLIGVPTTFDDILFTNHIVAKPTMKQMVDAWVKKNFEKRCMIDDYALASHVFEDHAINTVDEGHVAVCMYIIAKFCDLKMDAIKAFLADINTSMFKGDVTNFKTFLNRHGLTVVNPHTTKPFYRKLTGFFT